MTYGIVTILLQPKPEYCHFVTVLIRSYIHEYTSWGIFEFLRSLVSDG